MTNKKKQKSKNIDFCLFRVFITKFLIFDPCAIFSKIAKNLGRKTPFWDKKSELQGTIFRKVFGKPLKTFRKAELCIQQNPHRTGILLSRIKAPEENPQKPYISQLFSVLTIFQILIFNADDFFLVVAAASLAYPMGHHQSPALAALYQIHSAHFPVSPAFISSGFGRPVLWTDRHGLHLLKLLKQILDYRHSRVRQTSFAGTAPAV